MAQPCHWVCASGSLPPSRQSGERHSVVRPLSGGRRDRRQTSGGRHRIGLRLMLHTARVTLGGNFRLLRVNSQRKSPPMGSRT